MIQPPAGNRAARLLANRFAGWILNVRCDILQALSNYCRSVIVERRKSERLEKAGWRIGSASEFLGLTEEETRYIELKLALSQAVRTRRQEAGLSQEDLARRLGSSQSRVSKIESADATVSLDLLVRSLLTVGASREDIADAIVERELLTG
jgi:DNA-binding XRE family transcriptional regulator